MRTNKIGERQAGDLGGRLTGSGWKARVTVAVLEEFARLESAQHLVWMLLNLLARQPGEVERIELVFPSDIKPSARISPLMNETDGFARSALAAIARVNPDLFGESSRHKTDVFMRVGPGRLQPADLSLAISSDHWSGYVGSEPARLMTDSRNPIGPFIAASLGAAEIFKFVRALRRDAGDFARSLWVNGYSLEIGSVNTPSPELPNHIDLPSTALAGVGAVGNGFLQTLYSIPGIRGSLVAIDGDEKGVTETNLNRYVLFDLGHCTTLHMKASSVAEMFRGTDLKVIPVNRSWQEWRETNLNESFEFVISAVDRNSARHAIQDAMPRKILGASTNEMKLQVNFYDVFNSESVCLKCRNEIEVEGVPDALIIERLKKLTDEQRLAAAIVMDVDPMILNAYIDDPIKNCGKIAGSSLQKFASGSDVGEWTVGFVSFLAGVLLAAEYLKQINALEPRMQTIRNQFRFQFWRPEDIRANALTSLPPEAICICRSSYYIAVISSNRSIPAAGLLTER